MNQQHGAVAVKGGRVLAIGYNRLKNRPEITHKYGECSIHAEADVLSRVTAKKVTIYVARVNNSGNPTFSKPCDDCRELMISRGVRKVVYTDYCS